MISDLRNLNNMFRHLLIIIFIVLLSSWSWSIFSQNWFIGICCVLLSILLLLYFYNRKLSRQQTVFVICLWVILFAYLFSFSFDKNLFYVQENQYINVLKRQDIYSAAFNRYYKNRFGIYYFNKVEPFIYRYSNNIANLFNLEKLFVSNYSGEENKPRFPVLFLPPMILGLFYLLKSFNKKYAYFTIIFLGASGFLDTKNTLGPIMIYPIICANIGLGLIKLLNLKR